MSIAGPDQGGRVGEITGEAFVDDPVARWSLGSEAAVRQVFAMLCDELYAPVGHCRLLDDAAATMWLWPNQKKELSIWSQLRLAFMLRQGFSFSHVKRALTVDAAMVRLRPAFPHMYLFTVGVLPDYQGQGLGGRIIRETLAIADAMGVPSYLENSNPRNTGLYQRLGFQPQTTFEAAPGCPPITTMLRPVTEA